MDDLPWRHDFCSDFAEQRAFRFVSARKSRAGRIVSSVVVLFVFSSFRIVRRSYHQPRKFEEIPSGEQSGCCPTVYVNGHLVDGFLRKFRNF